MIADFDLRIENFILFAFGFGNLAMLGWLAAAAAPLLIHLWSRHRFRESPWAAMQFLLAAMRTLAFATAAVVAAGSADAHYPARRGGGSGAVWRAIAAGRSAGPTPK
jgi:hypothetical protein